MSTEKMKEIRINANAWSRLKDIQRKLGFRKWSATIDWLLNHQQGENTPEPVINEKLLQDIIGSKSWSQVQELMSSHNLDISGITRHLIDCHNILEQEDTHEKLGENNIL